MEIIITDKGATAFTSRGVPDDEYFFELEDLKTYDEYENSVRCVVEELAPNLHGTTVAKLLYLFSVRFLVANGEILALTSDELRKVHDDS
jgi:hypothetical protein